MTVLCWYYLMITVWCYSSVVNWKIWLVMYEGMPNCLTDQPLSWPYLPLGAVCMAGMAFIVGLCILEDETVGALQAIRTLFHTIRTVFKIEAFHTILWALWGVKKKMAFQIHSYNLKISISEWNIYGILTIIISNAAIWEGVFKIIIKWWLVASHTEPSIYAFEHCISSQFQH